VSAARWFSCAAWLVSWSVAVGAAAAPPGPPDRADRPRLAVSAAVGISSPADESVNQVYAGTHVPWSLDADVRVVGGLSAFAGFRSLAVDGQASGIDPSSGVSDDTRLTTRSIMFGVRIHLGRGRLGFFAGGGTALTSYTETWPDVDSGFSGDVWGPAVHGGVQYRVWRRIGVIGRVDYFRAVTGEGSLLDNDVNLGGLDVSTGVTIRF
jgi:hypothetical protein